MCLIAISWKAHSPYHLVVAANRDEELTRPTRAARFWEEAPGVLAGKDLLGGGTWMAASTTGRFAAVTNFREDLIRKPDAPSRGFLVLDFVRGDDSSEVYVSKLEKTSAMYGGFGLFLSDRESLVYMTNRRAGARSLEPGVYGLSNGYLDDPWPKVGRAKRELSAVLDETKREKLVAALFAILADRSAAPHDEAILDNSPIFIKGETYGTRSSTVLLSDEKGETIFAERTYDANGRATGTQTYRFQAR